MTHGSDYVVIGAGSAGRTIVSRLSEDPARRVLLLEAGGSNRRLEVRAPLAFATQFHSWNAGCARGGATPPPGDHPQPPLHAHGEGMAGVVDGA